VQSEKKFNFAEDHTYIKEIFSAEAGTFELPVEALIYRLKTT
jgi:hypothetical protein